MQKKIFPRLLCAVVVLSLSFGTTQLAFAEDSSEAVPFAALCGACGGRQIVVTRQESVRYRQPCMHGYSNGYDLWVSYYNNTYRECEWCKQGDLISSQPLGSSIFVCEKAAGT